jgi:hypothetical protein
MNEYFYYTADGEFHFTESEEEARFEAEISLETARQNVRDGCDWPEKIKDVCWGVVKGKAKEIMVRNYEISIL